MGKIIVCHSYYGCDTGCCGHAIEIDDNRIDFTFDHFNPNQDKQKLIDWVKKALTKKFGPDHMADIDWDNCVVVDFEDCKW